jgi:hypothetical protein
MFTLMGSAVWKSNHNIQHLRKENMQASRSSYKLVFFMKMRTAYVREAIVGRSTYMQNKYCSQQVQTVLP